MPRWKPGGGAAGSLLALALAAGVLVPGAARCQTALGSQRVGTSMGTFLKIGVGARAMGMAGAFTTIADDLSAVYWNPAGLVHLEKRSAFFTYAALPADLDYHVAAVGFPNLLGGVVAGQMGSIRAVMEETTELHPDGTGREFTYSDFLLGLSYARRFTDRLSLGLSLKYVRENLGEEVGGGLVRTWVGDVGTQYRVGYMDGVVAVALSNFGPNFSPSGEYTSYADNVLLSRENEYESFTPANTFRFGMSARPYRLDQASFLVALEFVRPEDNNETIRAGLEVTGADDRLALRTGYDFNADSMKFSAGVGIRTDLAGYGLAVDYAFTHSEFLGRIDRLSLSLAF